jgi:hypothetical protein
MAQRQCQGTCHSRPPPVVKVVRQLAWQEERMSVDAAVIANGWVIMNPGGEAGCADGR